MAGLINSQLVTQSQPVNDKPLTMADGANTSTTTGADTSDRNLDPDGSSTTPTQATVAPTNGAKSLSGTPDIAPASPGAPDSSPVPSQAAAPLTGGGSPVSSGGLITSNIAPTSTSATAQPDAANDPSAVGDRTIVGDNTVADPVQQAASSIGATLGTVDKQSTVQGQLEQLLSGDNALLQQARARALTEANNRGLVNSSMANQAGEEAAISQALPIAQQDANTYATQAGKNQDATNAFAQNDQQFQNSQSLADFNQQAARAAQAEGANQKLKDEEQQYQDSNSMFERTQAQTKELTEEQLQNQLQTANISAGAQVGAAGEYAAASEANAATQAATSRDIASQQLSFQRDAANLDAATRTTIAQMGDDTQTHMNLASLQANTVANYGSQFTSIMQSQMEPDDKQRALANLSALYGGSPYMPVNINISSLPPATTPPTNGSGTGTNNNGGGG